MSELERTPLFTALTRPQMFAGVTYNYFIINVVIAVELFLIFRSVWVRFSHPRDWRFTVPA